MKYLSFCLLFLMVAGAGAQIATGDILVNRKTAGGMTQYQVAPDVRDLLLSANAAAMLAELGVTVDPLVQLGNDGSGNGEVRLFDGANDEFLGLRVSDGEWYVEGALNASGLIIATGLSASGTVASGGVSSARTGFLFDALTGGDVQFSATNGHSGTHTVTWTTQGNAAVTVPAGTLTISGINVAETLGGEKTFTASSTQAGLRLGSLAGDPSSGLANGSTWYNSTLHAPRTRINGTTRSLLHSGSSLADLATRNAADLTGTLGAAQLPLPGTGSLGGVMRNGGAVGQFVNGINASGQLTFATPAVGLAPDGDGSMLTGITAAQVGALAPDGDGSMLTGITATQVGAVANGDSPTFAQLTLTDGIIKSQTGALQYKFFGVVDSTAVPYIEVKLYDDQDPPVAIGSALFGFRGDGGGGGKQVFQSSTNDFEFEGFGGTNNANVYAAQFIGGGGNLTNLNASNFGFGVLPEVRGGTGINALGTGVPTWLGTPSSANLRAALSDEVGTGAAYFVGGALGTPASVTLTNGTGLPIATGVSGLGSGVGTALSVNVGTAGSVVVNGGALGTPASGTVTNFTGTASININGTVGATTPAAGAFTSVTLGAFPNTLVMGNATFFGAANGPRFQVTSADVFGLRGGSSLNIAQSRALGWSGNASDSTEVPDLTLFRDAANTMAQRNGTNAQQLRVMNTWTSLTNNESFTVDWRTTSNTCRVGTEKGSGGGVARAMQLMTDGTARVTLGASGEVIQNSLPAPATATSTGTAGEVRYDADFIYRCVAPNTWKRAALSTW